MSLRRRLIVPGTLAVLLSNCGVATSSSPEYGETRDPSVYVINQSFEPRIIYDRYTRTSLGRVEPTSEGCMKLRDIMRGEFSLYAQRTRTGEPEIWTPRLSLQTSRWWVWTINNGDRWDTPSVEPGAPCSGL